jgi:ATP-dependent Clp protease protease subunit
MEQVQPSINDRYKFSARAADGVTLDIFNDIDSYWGYGVPALSYELSKINPATPLTVRIHSPGGSVTEGLALRNLLRAHPGGVTTVGVGFVASIASVILLAGNRVVMADTAYLMIHRPYGVMEGNADDMKQTANVLSSMDNTLLDIYMEEINKRGNRGGTTREQVFEMMKNETWLTAEQAYNLGFIDEIQRDLPAGLTAPTFEALAKYANAPKQLVNNSKNEMKAKSLMERLRALLTEEEISTMTTEELMEAAPEVAETAEAAIEETGLDPIMAAVALLEENGYTVTAPDATPAETEAEYDEKDEEMAKVLAMLMTEIKALKTQIAKAKAAPSGGAVATPIPAKAKTKNAQAFNSFAAIIQQKIRTR